jgi:hypothetical protein
MDFGGAEAPPPGPAPVFLSTAGGTHLPYVTVLKVTLRPRRPITSATSARIMLLIRVGVLALARWRDEHRPLTGVGWGVLR